MNRKLSFEEWMAAVDKEVERRLGLSVSDLPDCCFMDWFEDSLPAKSAAARAIREAGG